MEFLPAWLQKSRISSPAFTNAGSVFVSISLNSVSQMFFTESLERHQVKSFLEKGEAVSRIPNFYREQLDSSIFFYEKILTWENKGEVPVSFWSAFQEIRVFGRCVLVTHLPIYIQNSDSGQGCFLCFSVSTCKKKLESFLQHSRVLL